MIVRQRLPGVLAFVLGVAVLAGCGGDDEEATVTETVTESETAPTTSTESGEDDDGPSTTAAAKGVPGEVPVTRGPRYFQTPSGNIGCYVDARAARCDIRERNWDPPPADEPCELDYGQGIAVSARGGRADFVCAGDTALGGPATLDYGAVSRRGSLRCRSGGKGVTCTEIRSGHGFFLSRERYRIF